MYFENVQKARPNQLEHGLAMKKHWCKRKSRQYQSVTFRKDMSIRATFQQASKYFVQSTSHTKYGGLVGYYHEAYIEGRQTENEPKQLYIGGWDNDKSIL